VLVCIQVSVTRMFGLFRMDNEMCHGADMSQICVMTHIFIVYIHMSHVG